MSKKIVIIQGHPDSERHLNHLLADAYLAGAGEAGHVVTVLEIASLNFPVLRSKDDWDKGEVPADLLAAQEAIAEADHIVILYPLWLGTMPALLKAFLEQVLRPGFGASITPDGKWIQHLKGKSARVVITMGMPAFAYRWYFGAHSLKSLKRNILKFVGIDPVKATLVGGVDGLSEQHAEQLRGNLRTLGYLAI